MSMLPTGRTGSRSKTGERWLASPCDSRLRVEVHFDGDDTSALARDVRRGLSRRPKQLLPKYFYDDYGSQLFDAICDLPEYYLTRAECALLRTVADEVIALSAPDDLVEFGSGASRKTRLLLDRLLRTGRQIRYVPMDVSESMLRRGTEALLAAYPELEVHAVVGDYEQHLEHLPAGRRRLVAFLGSSIGNFTPSETDRFLSQVADRMQSGEHLLVGVDLAKSRAVLEAAYNDRAGLTAEFNRNILRVINRALDASFDPGAFAHVAFFNESASQIEMHLRAYETHAVMIHRLHLVVPIASGETIRTEISRKYTRADTEAMLGRAAFDPVRWFESPDGYFGLALAQRR